MEAEPIAARSGPSRAWYVMAAIIIVLGMAVAAWLVLRSAQGLTDTVTSLHRVQIPGVAQITLDRSGGYYIYFEGGSIPEDLAVVILPSGQTEAVPVQPYVGDLTYEAGVRQGVAVATFTVEDPGPYEVRVTSDQATPGAEIAIGGSVGGAVVSLVGGVFSAIAAAGLGLLIGAVIIIVVAVRRSRSRPPQG